MSTETGHESFKIARHGEIAVVTPSAKVEEMHETMIEQAARMVIQSLKCAPIATGAVMGGVLGAAAPIPGLPAAFAVFLPVRSVAVMGDGRRYDYVIALRAVETVDFMTARWARLPYEFLDICARRIINEVAGISRVTYDISGKPPATIEWE